MSSPPPPKQWHGIKRPRPRLTPVTSAKTTNHANETTDATASKLPRDQCCAHEPLAGDHGRAERGRGPRKDAILRDRSDERPRRAQLGQPSNEEHDAEVDLHRR